jgi:peptidoglycan/LPS O-acetylase OafA/YrhL
VNRERALKVVLVLVGLLFVAAIYPAMMPLWHASPEDDTGDTMMMSLYFTLGVFLLVAARKPSAHHSLIAFTAWSSFAHAVVMTILGFHLPSEQVGFWIGSAVLVVIGLALLALAPRKQPVDQAAPAGA